MLNFWIGLSDVHQEGNFVWTDGSNLTFQPWNPNQPDNMGGLEHCVHRWYGHGLSGDTWNDDKCENLLHYVCKSLTPF